MTVEATLEAGPSAVTEIADLARAGTEPRELQVGGYYVVQGGDGTVREIDLTGDAYRENPRQLTAAVGLTDVDSLIAYWDKHHDTGSDMWADRDKRTITAVLDAHYDSTGPDDERARWQSHRAALTLTLSDAMHAWLKNNGHILDQTTFAEFCEDWMSIIANPAAADLIEMIQSFQATVTASFKSGFKLNNGQREIQYTEQVEQSMKGGSVAVPQTITLWLPVWRGGAESPIEMTARIRTRINHNGAGKLGIGYKLDRPTEIVDAAFERAVARVEEHIGRPVLRGTPAGA